MENYYRDYVDISVPSTSFQEYINCSIRSSRRRNHIHKAKSSVIETRYSYFKHHFRQRPVFTKRTSFPKVARRWKIQSEKLELPSRPIIRLLWYRQRMVISGGFAGLYGQLPSLLPLLFLTISLVAEPLKAEKLDDLNSPAGISTLGNGGEINSKEHLVKYQYRIEDREPIPFDKWINQTQQNGIFFNRSSYAEGEVLLFRTKKNRHRAIAVMNVVTSPFASKFSDALTFKEWLKSVYSEDKALKLSVRTTEVVRPVLQHLYASKGNFRAPIIIHANTFANSGRNIGSASQIERPVDAVVFINAVAEYLPEAVISLGWTQSADYAALNRFDWRETFRLVDYIHHLNQPIILNMKLNDAVHSLAQLEWLLGVDSMNVFVIISGEMSDFVENNDSLRRLAALSDSDDGHKILFDVDEVWRRRLEPDAPAEQTKSKKEKRSVEPDQWTNMVFANSHEILSTSLVSSQGVAFLGWPNSLLISNRPIVDYSRRQRIAGRVLFLLKRDSQRLTVPKDSGMVVQLFEGPLQLVDGTAPRIRDSIRIFIGYEGRIVIENTNRMHDVAGNYKNQRRRRGEHSDSKDQQQYYYYSYYHKSSVGQLPKRPCYEFDIVDRNWRVELSIRSFYCDPDNLIEEDRIADGSHQLYLQLDTPTTRTHKMRKVAIGKSGDGTMDFIFQEIIHSGAAKRRIAISLVLLLFPLLWTLQPRAHF